MITRLHRHTSHLQVEEPTPFLYICIVKQERAQSIFIGVHISRTRACNKNRLHFLHLLHLKKFQQTGLKVRLLGHFGVIGAHTNRWNHYRKMRTRHPVVRQQTVIVRHRSTLEFSREFKQAGPLFSQIAALFFGIVPLYEKMTASNFPLVPPFLFDSPLQKCNPMSLVWMGECAFSGCHFCKLREADMPINGSI